MNNKNFKLSIKLRKVTLKMVIHTLKKNFLNIRFKIHFQIWFY